MMSTIRTISFLVMVYAASGPRKSFFPWVPADSEEHPHSIEFGARTDRMDSWGRRLRGVLIQTGRKTNYSRKARLILSFGSDSQE